MFRYFFVFTLAMCVVFLVNWYVIQLSTVNGNSMKPTIHDGDWLVVDKLAYFIAQPSVGDIAVLKEPAESSDGKTVYLVKRIVALPGDQVEIHEGNLFINHVRQSEQYVDAAIENGDFGPMTVPDGQYFVMGDNRRLNRSKDSRYFGPVERESIMGRIDLIIFPFDQIKAVH